MQGQSVQNLIESLGAEGFYHKICTLLNEQKLSVDDFSYYELAEACGVLPQLRRLRELAPPDETISQALRESNPGVGSNLFQVVTGELTGRKVIEGYEDDSGFIGDNLANIIYEKTKLCGHP